MERLYESRTDTTWGRGLTTLSTTGNETSTMPTEVAAGVEWNDAQLGQCLAQSR